MLHPHDLVSAIHVNHLAGDGRCAVAGETAARKRTSAPASHSVSGSLGAGSGHVSVTTMSGRVILLRRAGREQPDNESEMEGEAS